jgi:hypothetical protein
MEFYFIIALFCVFLLSVTLSSLFAVIFLERSNKKIRTEVDKIYSSEEFKEEMKMIVSKTTDEIYKDYVKTLIDVSNNQEKLNNLEVLTEKLLQQTNEISNFNPDKIDKILNDIIKRILTIEKSSSRQTPLEVELIPEDFHNLIKRDPVLKSKLQELLDVLVLRDVILRMVQPNLDVDKFFELEKDSVRRYWEYFLNSKDYLPSIISKLKEKQK